MWSLEFLVRQFEIEQHEDKARSFKLQTRGIPCLLGSDTLSKVKRPAPSGTSVYESGQRAEGSRSVWLGGCLSSLLFGNQSQLLLDVNQVQRPVSSSLYQLRSTVQLRRRNNHQN